MTAIWVPGQFFLKPLKNIGKENFVIDHIFFAFSFDDMIWAEKHFVDLTCVLSSNTYNVELGGINGFHEGNAPHNKGKRGLHSHSEETKLKMSIAHLGKPKSKEASIKSGLSRRGTKRTSEQLKRMSDAHKGYKWSEERKRAYSKTQTGRSFSESHCQSISAVAKARPKCSCIYCHKEMPINNLQYHLTHNHKCFKNKQIKR